MYAYLKQTIFFSRWSTLYKRQQIRKKSGQQNMKQTQEKLDKD